MVNKKDDAQFMPTVAIPPGETIRENMKYLRHESKGISPKTWNNHQASL